MVENINDLSKIFKQTVLDDIEEIENEYEKEIYYNRYVLYNNKTYSDVTIKFNKFDMYLNLKILSKNSKFFESKINFKNNNVIIEAKDIYDEYLPLQQILTWLYFQYKDIIKPINYNYISLFYLYNYLLMDEKILIQIIEMISDVKDEPVFYTKLYQGFKKRLLDEDTVIDIHKFITNKKEIFDLGFLKNDQDKKYCNYCGYTRYCCKKCSYCENDCKCKKIQHSLIYIFPALWLKNINVHRYPVNVIEYRKGINQNIFNKKIDITYEEVDKLLCGINEQIDEIKISINVIFGKIF